MAYSHGNTGKRRTSAEKARISRAIRKAYKNPLIRKKLSDAQRRRYSQPGARKAWSNLMKGVWNANR